MAGKMTILDRLMQSGKLKPGVARDLRVRGEFFDPLQYTTQQRILMQGAPERAYMAFPQNGVGRDIKLTPEREVYQKGLDVQYNKKLNKLDEDLSDANYKLERLTEQYGDDFAEAQGALADDMADWARNQLSYEYTDPYEVADVVRNEMPKYNLSDYWEGEYSLPEYQERFDDFNEAQNAADEALYDWKHYGRQRLQTQSPRYRNYQRAMETRAANRRMGHQLSRMWGDAYNRLRARGLSDAEARMYLHDYFGGR